MLLYEHKYIFNSMTKLITYTHTHTHTLVGPTAPQNFMLETIPMSSSQLQASWNTPNPTNGRITGYIIRCSTPDDPALLTFEEDRTSLILERLSPFTNYTCDVSATTGAGEGSSSESRTAQTDEDG